MRHYGAHGFAGCVQIRKARATGRRVGVYHGEQAGMDNDPAHPWVTLCEDHGQLSSHPTLALAKAHASLPEWCSECQAEIDRASVDSLDTSPHAE